MNVKSKLKKYFKLFWTKIRKKKGQKQSRFRTLLLKVDKYRDQRFKIVISKLILQAVSLILLTSAQYKCILDLP